MSPTESDIVSPSEPESLAQTGLPETLVEQLILKILFYRGALYGQGLSTAIGLRYSVIQPLVEALTSQHHIEAKRSLGLGSISSLFALTEAGRRRAREHMENNQYGGAAPVPHAQYVKMVAQQKRREGWLTEKSLREAFGGIVATDDVISQVGPALSSGNSLLIYGQPGNGKTFLIESLNNIESPPIFVPHAIECQGHIIRVYDPIYHQRLEEPEASESNISIQRSYDRRWVKCKRSLILSGGELDLEMLDLRYNATSKVYEAPFQLKANNGIYLIDDFGRQRATPTEILNRWIVPLERRVDYLTFLTGGKMAAPFEAFLVFSTNLSPADLGDEAFLRRMQYKMLLPNPSEDEFVRIFENCCTARGLRWPCALMERFIEKYYRQTGRPFRRCHPRDLLSHALGLMHFKKLPLVLTEEVLDRAFRSCFLQEEADSSPRNVSPSPLLKCAAASAAAMG